MFLKKTLKKKKKPRKHLVDFLAHNWHLINCFSISFLSSSELCSPKVSNEEETTQLKIFVYYYIDRQPTTANRALSKGWHYKSNCYFKIIRGIYSFTVASFNFEHLYFESNSNSSSNVSKMVTRSPFHILIPIVQVSGYMTVFKQHSNLDTKWWQISLIKREKKIVSIHNM